MTNLTQSGMLTHMSQQLEPEYAEPYRLTGNAVETYSAIDPTGWKSIPGFLRFTAWVAAIIFFINVIVVPALLIVGIGFVASLGSTLGN